MSSTENAEGAHDSFASSGTGNLCNCLPQSVQQKPDAAEALLLRARVHRTAEVLRTSYSSAVLPDVMAFPAPDGMDDSAAPITHGHRLSGRPAPPAIEPHLGASCRAQLRAGWSAAAVRPGPAGEVAGEPDFAGDPHRGAGAPAVRSGAGQADLLSNHPIPHTWYVSTI